MRLTELAAALPTATCAGDADISRIAYDSRDVRPGDLFVCIVGARFDGHAWAAAAARAGAAALAVQEGHAVAVDLPKVVVPNCRAALAPLALALYDNPSRRLCLAGVTGTNGKTTTVLLVDAIARAAGDVTGTIGTLGATVAGVDLPHDRTTPEAPDLQRLFAQILAAGGTSAAMEVASHALAQGRTDGCVFDVALFTNLTQDHLDYHGTMEAYRDAKGLLFTQYADAARAAGKSPVAVLNVDDPAGRHYQSIARADRVLTYTTTGDPSADLSAVNARLAVDSIAYTARTPIGPIDVRLGFGGTFNVANSLAALGYGIARGFDAETIAAGLAECPPVPGRFQPVRAGQEFAVLVDYAHTPDGLDNVLSAARPLTSGKLIVVFGCGGNRDKTKRPIMGQLACELADVAIATSDNPRREDPESILDDVLAGMDSGGAEVVREVDRRKAIAHAVRLAAPGDTVVIAGKGHEAYQEIDDVKHPFHDVAVTEEEIKAWLSR